MTLFANKYRIESARLKGWDYANGAYFVTICTKNRKHYFGNIRDGKMLFSEIGKIANDCWSEILNHFSSVVLGEWIIMPDTEQLKQQKTTLQNLKQKLLSENLG